MQEMKQREIQESDAEEEEESNGKMKLSMKEKEEELPYDIPDLKLVSLPSESAYMKSAQRYMVDYEEPEIEEIEIPAPAIVDVRTVTYNAETTVEEPSTYFEDVNVEYPDVSMYEDVVIDLTIYPDREVKKKAIQWNTSSEELERKSAVDSEIRPLLDEILEMEKGPYFPRGRTDIGDGPIAIVIGEDKKEWHEPILYLLRELFREITESFPSIYFRKPGDAEEVTEDIIDSIEPHSLEKFRFENRIEFLDAREEPYGIEEFFRSLQNRFEASYLQRFGIFVIAVKKEDMDEVMKYPSMKRMKVIRIEPDDERFKLFSQSIFGLESEKHTFREVMKEYNGALSRTVKHFSIFVKQGGESEGDREYEQYPHKVAIFEYLVKKEIKEGMKDNEEKMKKYLSNKRKLYEYIKEKILDENVVEVEKSFTSVIPDILYRKDYNIYIEFETLIGTLEPLKKIDHSVEKYKEQEHKTDVNISKDDEIWIVLRPISALIHSDELKKREEIYNEILYKGEFNVRIKVLCRTKNGDWVIEDLKEFEGNIRAMLGKLGEMR